MFRRKRNNNKGFHNAFTLVELLVVISIIALLISILMPALSKAKGLAQSAVCLSNIRQLSIANTLYAQSNDDECFEYPGGASNSLKENYWFQKAAVLLGVKGGKNVKVDQDVILCPSAKKPHPSPVQQYQGGDRFAWVDPSSQTVASYTQNCWTSGKSVETWIAGHSDYKREYVFMTLADCPPLTPIFADGVTKASLLLETDNYTAFNLQDGIWYLGLPRITIDRHSKAINIGMTDGTAKHIKLQNLTMLKWHKEYKVDYKWDPFNPPTYRKR